MADDGVTRDHARRRRINTLLAVKSAGYLISTLSVVLLGVVSWRATSNDPQLAICLLIGMACSIAGMFLRWVTYQIEVQSKASGQDA